MGKPTKNMRSLMAILKDKVSVLKAVLSLSSSNNPTTSLHVAVIRATTHHPIDPPPDETDTLLEISRHSTTAVVAALLRRLHRTRSVHVALKCLIALHRVLPRASVPATDRLINISSFRDDTDHVTWELSNWARWFADVIEQRHFINLKKQSVLSPEKELSTLVAVVELISSAPETLHYQKISSVYEVMKLVCEDYRIMLREITSRVELSWQRVKEMDDESLEQVLDNMKKLEECKEKLFKMFLNKKRNDGVWEMVDEVKRVVEGEKGWRDGLRMVEVKGGELTRREEDELRERENAIVPVTRGKRWLDVEWNTLVVSFA